MLVSSAIQALRHGFLARCLDELDKKSQVGPLRQGMFEWYGFATFAFKENQPVGVGGFAGARCSDFISAVSIDDACAQCDCS